MKIIIIMCWSIWKQRNAWIFNVEEVWIDAFGVSSQILLWLFLEKRVQNNHP
jgi:hypothetical protein